MDAPIPRDAQRVGRVLTLPIWVGFRQRQEGRPDRDALATSSLSQAKRTAGQVTFEPMLQSKHHVTKLHSKACEYIVIDDEILATRRDVTVRCFL
jgi:hypothetical protein